MAQLTGSRIFNAIKGLFVTLDSTDELMVKRILGVRQKIRIPMSDGGATATSVAATQFFTNDQAMSLKVVAANLFTPVTVAPGATDNCAFVLEKVDSAAGNAATIASYTSNVAGGTATAYVPKALTVVGGTSTVAVVASGWSLRAKATKGASGVPFGAATAPAYLEVTIDYDT